MKGLYDLIRQRITARQAAEAYGVKINRAGRALCPWHDDHTPDLAFYDARCYCHACHNGGDAVALTAQLYNMTMLEAAQKVNSDFQLGLDADTPTMQTGISEAQRRQREREAEWRLESTLCAIVREADARLSAYRDANAWEDLRFLAVLKARCRASLALDNIWAGVCNRGRAG